MWGSPSAEAVSATVVVGVVGQPIPSSAQQYSFLSAAQFSGKSRVSHLKGAALVVGTVGGLVGLTVGLGVGLGFGFVRFAWNNTF